MTHTMTIPNNFKLPMNHHSTQNSSLVFHSFKCSGGNHSTRIENYMQLLFLSLSCTHTFYVLMVYFRWFRTLVDVKTSKMNIQQPKRNGISIEIKIICDSVYTNVARRLYQPHTNKNRKEKGK